MRPKNRGLKQRKNNLVVRPSVEHFERRQLLASGFLQGTVFTGGVAASGATIELTQPGNTGFTPIDFTTGPDGIYTFTGLTGGNYRVTEVAAPAGTVPSGVHIVSPIDPYSNVTNSSFDVQVVDPDIAPLQITYVSRPAGKIPMQVYVNSFSGGGYVGQFDYQASGGGLTAPTAIFQTICLDPLIDVFVGDTYSAVPVPANSLAQHGPQIAYLANKYGSTALSPDDAASLQLAVWELVVDPTPSSGYTTSHLLNGNPNSGGLSVSNNYGVATTEFNTIIQNAVNELNDAISPNKNLAAVALTTTPPAGKQPMLAPQTFDFNNVVATATISGYDYLVSNTTLSSSLTTTTTGSPIVGTTVVLTGTDVFGNTVSKTTTTNSSGYYTFTGLAPSNTSGYTLTETPPTGDTHLGQTSTTTGAVTTPSSVPVVSNIVLNAGQSSNDNFFETFSVSVNGTDYAVSNTTLASSLTTATTGVPIAGTTIVLSGTDAFGNAVSKTATTAANGTYSFTGLNPSNATGYTVTETTPAGYTHLGQTSTTTGASTTTQAIAPIVLNTPGATSTDNYFETFSVSVNGTDYYVSNTTLASSLTTATTGVPIAGTTIVLSGTDAFGNVVSKTATTAANGTYSFTGLNPSNATGYTVTETTPAGYTHLGQTSTTTGASTTTQAIAPIVLNTPGATSTDNYFETFSVSVNGTDYYVSNTTLASSLTTATTGVPVAGTTIVLSGTDAFGNAVSKTATTAANGTYSFTGLNPSDATGYTVTETTPAGYTHLGQTSTTTGASTATQAIAPIVLNTPGATSTDNFFETFSVSVNGTDYYVSNTTLASSLTTATTGVPVAGTTIVLSGTDAFGNAVSKTATTATNGTYSFTGLNPSNATGYTVTETTPAGYTHLGQTSTTTGASTATQAIAPIVLNTPGATSTDNFFETFSVSVNGTDYYVSNTTLASSLTTATTGVPVAGTTIVLSGTDAFGNAVSKTATTATNGTYSFTGLNPSNASGYKVTETTPAGYTHLGQTSTTTGASTTTQAIAPIVLNTPGATSTDNYFETFSVSVNGTDYYVSNTTLASSLTTATTGVPIAGTTIVLSGTDAFGNAVSKTATTAANGTYSFTGLNPSDATGYTVTETTPAGYTHLGQTSTTTGAATTTQAIAPIVLNTPGATSTDNYFETFSVSVNGTDYYVSNTTLASSLTTATTGVPVAGTTIVLSGTDAFGNVVSKTATTAANGTYSFTGLNPSNATGYTVTETTPAGYTHLGQTSTTTGAATTTQAIAPIVLNTPGATSTDNYFETFSVSVNGTDYYVSNTTLASSLTTATTGVPVAGTTIVLSGTDAFGNVVSKTATTAANGTYSFTGLNPSNATGYTVTETTPAGYTHLGQTSTTTGAATTTQAIAPIVLNTPGATSTDNYFETFSVSVNGTDYYVSNTTLASSLTTATTGVPVAGTTIVLSGTDAFGNVVSKTATTAANGTYSFTGLNPSNATGYTVTETTPVGYTHLGQTSTTTGAATTTQAIAPIVLNTPGATSTDNYFETFSVSVNGTDYYVSNTTLASSLTTATTGVPIAGTTIVLSGTDAFGNAVSKTATTATNGTYSFTGLNPSNASGYKVTETTPAGYTHLGQTSTTTGASTTTQAIAPIVLNTPGATSTDNYFETFSVSVNGTDYYVSNTTLASSLTTATTGVPVAGTTIVLSGTDAFGNAVSKTATTAANGTYSFTGLNPSNATGYTVTETTPAGYTHLGQTSTTTGASTTTQAIAPIVLNTPGATSTDNYFETFSVSVNGTDYYVSNTTLASSLTTATTGVPIAGTTIVLSGTDAFGNVVSKTATTAANGTYSFTGLNPSNATGYTVTETTPAGYTHLGQTSTTTGASTTTQAIAPIVLNTPGATSTDNYFETFSVSVNGTDYYVSNTTLASSLTTATTGVPIAGTTIVLSGTDAFGNAVSKTATTATNGTYSFTGLNPSNASGYKVTETTPVGYTHLGQTSTTTGASTTTQAIAPIVLNTPGATSTDNYFETFSVSVNGTDYYVSNTTLASSLTTATTGVPIAGTTIVLSGTDAFGNVVSKTATTAANGTYSFTGLNPSNATGYTVTETTPAGYTHLGQTSTTTGASTTTQAIAPIVLNTPGATSTDNYFETFSVSVNGTDYYVSNTTLASSLTTATTGVPVAGTTIVLSGTDAFGNVVSKTATTAANGTYSFTGLNPSNASGYKVTETTPVGYTHLGQTSTTTGASTTTQAIAPIVLNTPGATSTDNYFETFSVSVNGTDYYVSNTTLASSLTTATTGVPVAGTTIVLSGTDAFGNVVSKTATTAANGTYSFTGLNPSDATGYTVTETTPAGYTHLGQTSTTTGAATTTQAIAPIVLNTPGATSTDNYFETFSVSVNGTDYYVSNTTLASSLTTATTGVPVAGTTIVLSGTDAFGNVVSKTATTAANGTYSFTGLNPSNATGYTVTETTPAGYTHLGQTSTTTGAATTTQAIAPIVLNTPGATSTDNYFETFSVSINGTDYYVSNTTLASSLTTATTGVPVAGTTIVLSGTDAFGNVVSKTATTAANGTYSFTGLNPSNASGYKVTETTPAGYTHLGQTSTTTGAATTTQAIAPIVLNTPGATSTDNYFETFSVSVNGTDYYVSNTTLASSLTTATTGVPVAGTTIVLSGTDAFGNVVSKTATTAANGTYSFTGLNPSNATGYTVTETTPAGYTHLGQTSTTTGASTATQAIAPIVLTTPNASSTDNYFETFSVSVNGTDYYVSNTTLASSLTTATTGVPVAGTTIVLSGTDAFGNVVSKTATTAANGTYSFTGLNPSNASGYKVTETTPVGYTHLGQTSTTTGASTATQAIAPIVLNTPGATSTDNYFETFSVSVNGTDYYVSNTTLASSLTTATTGVPIAGTTIVLSGTDAFGNAVSKTATTAANGTYSFTGLNPSNASGYKVTETTPAGYTHLGQTSTTTGAATTTQAIAPIVLTTPNASSTDNYFETFSVSVNGADYQVPNTTSAVSLTTATTGTPISGTTIVLSGVDAFGNTVSKTATTNSSGQYSFTGLNPSSSAGYTVTETPPANLSHLGQVSTTPGAVTTTPAISKIVLVVSGATSTNNYFETTQSYSITGTKYIDTTGNGLSADFVLPTAAGVTTQFTIGLFKDTNNNGILDTSTDQLVTTTLTAVGTGAYSFNNLPAGNYLVEEYAASGFVRTYPVAKDYYAVTVGGSTKSVTGIDFANYQVDNCGITNISYEVTDVTSTGVVTTNTVTNLRGNTNQGDQVTVTFTVPAGDVGEQLTLVAYTAPGASFDANVASQQKVFDIATATYSAAGTYSLTVQLPNSYYQVDFVCGSVINTFGPAGSNVFYTPQGRLFSADNDGKNAPLTNPGNLAGSVFVDSNANGIQGSGDTGLAGVQVTLKQTSGGNLTLVRYTNSNGNYSFKGLPTGTYSVTEAEPAGYVSTLNGVNRSLGGIVSGDTINSITVGANQSGVNYNFGEAQPLAQISGLVFNDLNYDGSKQSNELGILNVTVTLTGVDYAGNAVSKTTTTNSSGQYTFMGLLASNSAGYTITESPVTGYYHEGQDAGSTGGSVADRKITTVITPGAVSTSNNFFEVQNGAVLCNGFTGTIVFWNNSSGQSVITCLNGGSTATNLATWLATEFPNLYGSGPAYSASCTTGRNLTGKTNADVAALFKTLFSNSKNEAQILCTALSVYVTNPNLNTTTAGQYQAQKFGFNLSTAVGTGAATYNVGTNGSLFGVANNTNLTIYQYLFYVNSQSSKGNLLNGNSTNITNIAAVFNSINNAGNIGG